MPAEICEPLDVNLNFLKELFKQEDFYFATPTMYFTAKKGENT